MWKPHKGAFSYSATCFAGVLMNSVFSFYYVKIYVNRLHVKESWFNTAQVIFMIWNAINDPLFGYIQDNFKISFIQTRRHSILYGAPLFVVSFLVIWFPWDTSGSGSWLTGIQLLVVLCLYDALFTYVMLAQCALFAEMSYKEEDRLRLIQYSQIATLCGSGGVYFCETLSHNLDNFEAFQFACTAIAVVSFISLCYTGLHAHTQYDEIETDTIPIPKYQSESQDGIFKQTFQILRERNFMACVLTAFCQIYSSNFSNNFSSIFCDRLIPVDVMSSSVRSAFYGSLFLLPPIFILFGVKIIPRFGFQLLLSCSFLLAITISVLLYIVGPHPWMLVIYFIITRVNTAGSFKLFDLCLSLIIEEDQMTYKRPHPLSSMVFGTSALITKPAQSFAPMITLAILNRHGYQETDLVQETTLVSDKSFELDGAMFNLLVWTPIILGLLQLILWSFYKRSSHKSYQSL